jgi:hypothetical protein
MGRSFLGRNRPRPNGATPLLVIDWQRGRKRDRIEAPSLVSAANVPPLAELYTLQPTRFTHVLPVLEFTQFSKTRDHVIRLFFRVVQQRFV